MKYMGSKARIAKHILPIMLKHRKEGQWAVPDCMYVDLCLFWEANILGTQSCVVGMQS